MMTKIHDKIVNFLHQIIKDNIIFDDFVQKRWSRKLSTNKANLVS